MPRRMEKNLRKILVRLAGLQVEIWTEDLQNTKDYLLTLFLQSYELIIFGSSLCVFPYFIFLSYFLL
jgi:hypothetical protein